MLHLTLRRPSCMKIRTLGPSRNPNLNPNPSRTPPPLNTNPNPLFDLIFVTKGSNDFI